MAREEYKLLDSFWIDEDQKVKAIRRSNSPVWYIQYNLPGVGQQKRSLKTTSKKQARINGSKIACKIAAGDYAGNTDRNVTVGTMIRARIDRLRQLGRSELTVQIYERFYGQLVAFLPRGEDTPMAALVPATLEAFEDKLRSDGIALPRKPRTRGRRVPHPLQPKTLRDAMKAVRGLIRFALRRGSIHKDPSAGYDLPPGESKDIVNFTSTELAGLLSDPEPELADIWKFLTHTCLRVGEFTWLTVCDVVLDNNGRPKAVHIRRKTCPFTGKTWRPKHGVERIVPLTAEAADIVAAAIESSSGTWLFEFKDAQSNQRGKWGYSALRTRLKKRLKDIGAKHRSLHTFRHTGATHLANDVHMPLPQLQRFLGHSDIKTTMRYLHPSADDVAQSIAAVDYSTLIGISFVDNDSSEPTDSSEATVEDPSSPE